MKLFEVYSQIKTEPVRAKGVFLFDKNGKKYLDFFGGHAVISIGHSHPEYIKNLSKQLKKISFYSNAVINSLQIKFAKKLGKISGYEDYSLFLCNSGAEANENAMKLASFQNGKKKVIVFTGSFHGRTSLAVAATDNPNLRAEINKTDNIIYCDLNDKSKIENIFSREEISSVLIEGIQGVAGIKSADIEYWNFLRDITNKHNALLIADEIQSGYGRTGKFFAHSFTDVKPDIITIAKGMGNGFPMGGVLISPVINSKIEMLGSTFGGGHLACVAGLTVLDVIQKENLMKNARKSGEYLIGKLKKLNNVKEIRGKGLMLGIEFNADTQKIRNTLLNDYKIFTGISWDKKTLRILPPLNVKKSELDIFIKSLEKTLKSCTDTDSR
ncbi:MAG TPA: aspartate aminotransferase family protein [Bacteroidetes bacterium]|nr:aspartate aminotransferase family protein [Ignavibacteria bacterium]HCA42493.1 aspartate aminotransferase family protein [Bacteroidota bacterium]